MINAVIVDDEKDGAEVLQFLLNRNCPHISIVAIEHTINGATKSILGLKPELVFLDIEMATGTGFEIIQATSSHVYEKIFITAYEQYALRAIKNNASDYLLKPIDVDELIQAVKNVDKRIQANKLLRQSGTPKQESIQLPKKIMVPTQEGVLLVDTDDIIHLEADSNYTHIFTKAKRKFTVAKTLKSFEEQLPKNQFFRVHSAYLVNLNEVARYIKGDGGTLVLKDSSNIPVSRAHKQELMARLKQ